MSEATIKDLAWLGYDLASIDANLADLASVLNRCTRSLPACRQASRAVARVRQELADALAPIDEAVTAAIRAAEGE